MESSVSRVTQEPFGENGFLKLEPNSVDPEEVVLMLERYAEGRVIDRKAIRAIQGKQFTSGQFKRMILAACKGYRAMGSHLKNANEYSNILAYLCERSIK